MQKNRSLTMLQEDAIAELSALPEQGKRAAAYGHTLLNKPPRSIRRIRKQYQRDAMRMGFRAEQAVEQWSDVMDMARLEVFAR